MRDTDEMRRKKSFWKSMKNESGMMVVEAALSFVVFIMVCLAIVFLINIFTVHNRIQFAINSAAKEIASCTYLTEVLGLREAMKTVASDGKPYMDKIDDTTDQVVDSLNQIQNLYSDGQTVVENASSLELNQDSISSMKSSLSKFKDDASVTVSSVKASISSTKDLFSDSNGLIAGIIYMTADKVTDTVRRIIGSAMATGLTKHYLKQGEKSADDYLKSYHIKDGYDGLDFSGSSLLCDEKMRVVDIVVEYDIDLEFLKFVLPDASLHMVQRVSVAAWVGGDDQEVVLGE